MSLERIKRKIDDLCIAKSITIQLTSLRLFIEKEDDKHYLLTINDGNKAFSLDKKTLLFFIDVQLINQKCINISMIFP